MHQTEQEQGGDANEGGKRGATLNILPSVGASFQHFAVLYVKYINIYRKLEDTYDQIINPQKRAFIKV